METEWELPQTPEEVAEEVARLSSGGMYGHAYSGAWPGAPYQRKWRIAWACLMFPVSLIPWGAAVLFYLVPPPVPVTGWLYLLLAVAGVALLWVTFRSWYVVPLNRKKALADPEWGRAHLIRLYEDRAERRARYPHIKFKD